MFLLHKHELKIICLFADLLVGRLSAKLTYIHQAIARIMADKVYTSAEFKRERDNFHVSSIW